MAFFALILTVWSNPFAMTLPAPADGRGLNPLLQNPGMIIHPPLLFLGYGGFTVPSCLALAIACSSQGTLEKPWHRSSRAFCITAWAFLTAGILLGCWWAYMELGWGGYWGWDPVENASLIPWLVATATFHTLAMERRGGLLARTNVFLISLTTIAGFFATYLVRSGVIDSVHAFGQSPVGTPLLVFICAMLLLSAGIAFQSPRRGRGLANPASREGLLLLTVCTLLALAAVILLATMWPVVSRLWTQAPQGLDAKFYNRVCLPLGTLLALALALCPLLSWKGAFDARRGLPVLLLASLAAGLCAFLGYAQPHPLAATFAASAAIGGLALFMILKLLGRPSSDFSLGALGCHLGLALFVLGVAFSGPYKNEADLSFVQGEPQTLGGYEFVLKDLQQGRQPGYEFLLAEIEVKKDGRAVGILRPEKRAYDKFGGMFFTEVDVLPSLGEELYASLSGVDGRGRAVAKVSVEPLVNWLWIGGTLMSLMPLLALRRRKTKAEAQ
ncbi:MAG: cytochrome c biogenesis protein CcsA, partial [Desulfovibrio sp.]|nr:cytochrome c biogenesis protein CcsA [Desulfovibrio sp.]